MKGLTNNQFLGTQERCASAVLLLMAPTEVPDISDRSVTATKVILNLPERRSRGPVLVCFHTPICGNKAMSFKRFFSDGCIHKAKSEGQLLRHEMGGNPCLCVTYRLIHFFRYQPTIQYLLIFLKDGL